MNRPCSRPTCWNEAVFRPLVDVFVIGTDKPVATSRLGHALCGLCTPWYIETRGAERALEISFRNAGLPSIDIARTIVSFERLDAPTVLQGSNVAISQDGRASRVGELPEWMGLRFAVVSAVAGETFHVAHNDERWSGRVQGFGHLPRETAIAIAKTLDLCERPWTKCTCNKPDCPRGSFEASPELLEQIKSLISRLCLGPVA
jgi:hypothetical protein